MEGVRASETSVNLIRDYTAQFPDWCRLCTHRHENTEPHDVAKLANILHGAEHYHSAGQDIPNL
jgi:hypothetical protein